MILTITASPTIDVTYKLNSVNLHNVNRVESTLIEASGKGINVSSALADQNIKTEAIAAIPNSSIGDFWVALCRKFPVFTSQTDNSIRVNTSIVDMTGVTKINEKAKKLSTVEIIELLEIIKNRSLITKPDWLVFSGTIHEENSFEILSGVLSIAREMGAKIAIDTSGLALKQALVLNPDFIKPNLDELIEINPGIANNSQAIKKYIVALSKQINGVVLCTNGGEVGYASNTIDLLEVTPLVINGANSVGAGDAAVAGYLAGEISGSDFASAVKMAMLWASAACQNKKTGGLNNNSAFKEGAKIRSITPSNLSA